MQNNLIFTLKKKVNQLQNELAEEKNFLSSLLDIQPSLVVVLDPEGRIIKFNQACTELTGYTSEEIKGQIIWETLIPKHELKETKEIFKQLKAKDFPNEHQNHWLDKYGNKHLISWSNTIITNQDKKLKYIVGTGIDITKSKEQENKINYLNFHDHLTDLYNRSYLEDKMHEFNDKEELPISLIMGDANGLKLINDTYGHAIGDQMLIEIASILTNSCRREDIIARWGGDEFVVLLPKTTIEEARLIAQRIEKRCSQATINQIPLSMALGTAVKEDLTDSIIDVLKRAEDRMYKNKLVQSKDRKKEVLKSILFKLKSETDEVKRHLKHVEKVSLALGVEIGFDANELNNLSLLAVVHDIGKITINPEILNKTTPLSKEERRKINKHPEKGHQIVSSSNDLAPIADGLLYHHENWDGSGYPLGLSKNEIPLKSRIIHLAISYNVMKYGRAYKEPLTKEEIIAELNDNSGSQFDPSLTANLIKLIKNNNIKYPANKFSRNSSLINEFLN